MEGKWIQKAADLMKKRHTLGSFGKATSKNISKNLKKGGKMAKKAAFAKAMKTIAARRKKKK